MKLNGFRDEIVAKKIGRGVAVDFDWQRQKLYWCLTSRKDSFFYQFDLNGTETINNKKASFRFSRGEFSGIAVDWMAGNLYWSDQSKI